MGRGGELVRGDGDDWTRRVLDSAGNQLLVRIEPDVSNTVSGERLPWKVLKEFVSWMILTLFEVPLVCSLPRPCCLGEDFAIECLLTGLCKHQDLKLDWVGTQFM